MTSGADLADPFVVLDAERTRCEIWTRVMGYHRPTAGFNPGKQSEHRERQYFRESVADQHPLMASAIPMSLADDPAVPAQTLPPVRGDFVFVAHPVPLP